MAIDDEFLARGWRFQQAGEWRQAEQAYRELLHASPGRSDAWCLLAQVCEAQGKQADAIACYEQAVRIQPEHAEARACLATLLAQCGRLDEGIAHFQQAIRSHPGLAKAHHNLGVARAQQGESAAAIVCFREALRLQPDYAEAHFNLGNTLGQRGEHEEAIACYRQALVCRPDYVDVLNNLGLALSTRRQAAEAVVLLKQATRLAPQLVLAHNNLGLALAELGRFSEAEVAYEEALHLDPRFADAHMNLGSTFKESGRHPEALACYQMALRLQPDSPSNHWNRALLWLQMGNYEQGWPEYEWRWRKPKALLRPFRQPIWDGSPLAGRTILLHPEQGYGDTIQFLRYAPLVKAKGGRVLLECHPFLKRLFSSCPGIDVLVPEDEPLPDFDVHAPLMSLPAIFGTTLATVPAEIPYLFPEPGLVEAWKEKLVDMSGFRVGIAWQGNPHHQWDHYRSIPLALFESLAHLDGVSLVSLQKSDGALQIQQVADRFTVMDLGSDLDEQTGAFVDTAAVMKSLDLVICADTSIAHLAGALGVPVWIALSKVPDWRWLLDRDDSPWYPTARLFRQRTMGDWTDVIERMAAGVERQISTRTPRGAASVPISPGELLDKISILEIKQERIVDPAKLKHVAAELKLFHLAADKHFLDSLKLTGLREQLKSVNEALWDIEDALRVCEARQEFEDKFVELARSVYRHNDERAALKRQINDLLGASIIEEKSYTPYLAGARNGVCESAKARPERTAARIVEHR